MISEASENMGAVSKAQDCAVAGGFTRGGVGLVGNYFCSCTSGSSSACPIAGFGFWLGRMLENVDSSSELEGVGLD
jgi:hypothetical protein